MKVMIDWKTYACRSFDGDFHFIGGEDMQDAIQSYKNVLPHKKLESIYLLLWQDEQEDE
jgi:hypothetical protein